MKTKIIELCIAFGITLLLVVATHTHTTKATSDPKATEPTNIKTDVKTRFQVIEIQNCSVALIIADTGSIAATTLRCQ